ncbi:MAG: hypothetical protein ACI4QR_05425 [Eubacteriales bacterium]
MFEGSDILLVIIMSALGVLLTLTEYLIVKKHRAVFTAVSAVFVAAAALIMIYKGAALCDMLLFVVITLSSRLFFEIRMGRNNK